MNRRDFLRMLGLGAATLIVPTKTIFDLGANRLSSLNTWAIRKDLTDIISIAVPIDTPLISMLRRDIEEVCCVPEVFAGRHGNRTASEVLAIDREWRRRLFSWPISNVPSKMNDPINYK